MNNLYELEKSEVEEAPIQWPKENPLAGLNDAFKKMSVTIDVAVNAIRQVGRVLCECVYKQYPNRRVVHLALHSKRVRTRKKNRNRILRDLKREMKQKKGMIPDGRKDL